MTRGKRMAANVDDAYDEAQAEGNGGQADA
jgi:hypothetical protein